MRAFSLQEHLNITPCFKLFEKLKMFGNDVVSSLNQGRLMRTHTLAASEGRKLGGQRPGGSEDKVIPQFAHKNKAI